MIIQQPLDAGREGAYSNLGPSNQQMADNFALASESSIQSISWYGRYGKLVKLANPVAFTIRFFKDAGGSPAAAPVAEFDVKVPAQNAGASFGGVPWLTYTTALALKLPAGKYWVSVVEQDPRTTTSGDTQWLWAQSGKDGPRAFRLADGAVWSVAPGSNQAVILKGQP
jgi:hypothetical protein